MNQRIKELAEQSGAMFFDRHTDYFGDEYSAGVLTDRIDLQKFSELLIKECSSFLKDTLDDHFAAEQLEEHFEVEE